MYSQEARYGPGKAFESRQDFFDELNQDPANGKKQLRNGLWFYCYSTCGRNGHHEASNCPKKPSCRGQTGAKSYMAALNKSSKSSDDKASVDWNSDLDNSISPQKKTTSSKIVLQRKKK